MWFILIYFQTKPFQSKLLVPKWCLEARASPHMKFWKIKNFSSSPTGCLALTVPLKAHIHFINPILCHQRFSSPIFCANHCHLDRNIATSPESWWQFSFEPSADLNKVFFHDLIQKTSKIWILKTLVRIFTHFQAFFINPWSRGKHSWLWIGRSGFKSRSRTENFQNIF